ncbi:glycoside hydrolase family 2 TIM barrel-domain containing protein [Aquimarina agarivorans]|uniref:glycoside hydrolase family 2 TIM barrel-domain containing protein n=1 Tax=Aquimarina agarivorans TaxID=980584 RepID=UPI000248E8FF|nr:glycoside hydrolase family 2 TIM barrel-domain containing protein [Aquimarina agarivorans]
MYKLKVIVLILSLLNINLIGQHLNDWENPAVIGINKLPPRATMYSFKTEKEALLETTTTSDRVQLLNGDWQFNFSASNEATPNNFLNTEFKDWDIINVPSNWEMQGYGERIYTNQRHSWGHLNWPKISPTPNPVGIYKKEFTVPSAWQNMNIRIHFAGVTSAFYVWINGQKVGYSQGSRTPAEFDITAYLNKGKNTIIAKVFRWSDGSYVESQDHWDLSGIHRDVMLLAEPKANISDFKITTKLDEAYTDAILKISPKLSFDKSLNANDYEVTAALYDGTKKIVTQTEKAFKIANIFYGQRWNPKYDVFNIPVSNPQKWSAEAPYLYTLTLTLKTTQGVVVESKSCKVGFRKYETKKGVFLVNGKPVKLYGVNRHDHNAYTGKTVSFQDMKKDVMLLKAYNFNAVRCSHYPNNVAFYDLCDQYGIYVMDEANVESHGTRGSGGELASNPQWTTTFVDRAIRMYQRDKNHPCIFSWSLGNESGAGANHSAMAGYLKWNDPERLIHYEGAESYGGILSPQSRNTPKDPYDFTDMISRMYPSVEEFAEMDESQPGEKMVITCEYSHAMGNSNGGLKLFWDVARSHPRIAGGFIWDWMDQGIAVKSKNGCEQFAYGGYFGDTYSDGNFCLNGIINADQTVKPVMEECKHVFQPFEFSQFNAASKSFTIKNRNAFTNSMAYDFSYQLIANGTVIKDQVFEVKNILPGEKQKVAMPDLKITKDSHYFLNIYAKQKKQTAWAKKGYVVASAQFEFPYVYKQNTSTAATIDQELQLIETKNKIQIKGKDFEVEFNTLSGYLTNLITKKERVLAAPIAPNFWRATTDNDRAVIQRKPEIKFWKQATQNQQLLSFKKEQKNKMIEVVSTYQLGAKEVFFNIKYSIYPTGEIIMKNTFTCKETLANLPRIGVQTQLAAPFTEVGWLGKGPHENYVDRNDGAFIGLYKKSLANFSKSYVYPQAYGNRTNVSFANFISEKSKLKVASEKFEFSVYPYTTMDLDTSTYQCQLTKLNGYTLNLDYKQQGVAGYNSWSLKAAPRPEHSIPATNYEFDFKFSF